MRLSGRFFIAENEKTAGFLREKAGEKTKAFLLKKHFEKGRKSWVNR